ncbi:MAG: hypothetical protein JRJ69_16915 [Deltaproteobacteria bacterium]|nr:hypothetical protein [Deltaproteobacteria bacterium]MBW1739158.1 hypothetical protein [Deltaproteobacteria bacterium]MBW1911246.1 hypothetical protein [Deltaproteobacteria bacterium]MBW2035575.1 hypothetical protein [Deltaproteobacteria bacterium]
MKNKTSAIIVPILLSFFVVPGLCLDSEDIIRLNQAGISGKTIQLLVREKTIETCSLTIEEIVDLKNAGLSDETIRMLIREASFIKDVEPMVYGKDIKPIKFTTIKDIIELKNAGVSDDIIQAIIIFATRDVNDVEREKAWDMLKNMGIIVDMREASD